MVVDAFIQILVEVVAWAIGFLPSEPGPPAMASAVGTMVQTLSGGIGIAGTWINLSVLASVITITITWRGGIAAFRLLVWTFALLHLGGTT